MLLKDLHRHFRFYLSLLIVITGVFLLSYADAGDNPESAPIIFDLHSDTIGRIYKTRNVLNFNTKNYQASLPFLRAGSVRAQFVAVGGGEAGKEYDYVKGEIDFFYDVIEKFHDYIAFAGSVGDLEKNIAAGKISCFLAIEGGEVVREELSNVEYFYGRGVRYMTLTWNYSNKIADAAKDPKKPHGGLSAFGETVVKRMNELGMIIDLSHASDDTVRDVLKISAQPVIASHSNCHALWPHKRNLRNDLIRGICESGGVIGVNFFRAYITGRRPVYVSDLANHIDHIRKTGGIGCVALGSDYDGFIRPPVGLENYGKISNLTEELTRRGYSREDIEKIYYLNAVRVLKKVFGK